MDTILVVNAGSSSVKFQVFAPDVTGPRRLLKGQVDGIGTKPRLRAEAADKTKLIDQTLAEEKKTDETLTKIAETAVNYEAAA